MFNNVDTKEEKRILVGVYHEEESLSKLICENLKDKEGYIKFLVYDNKAEMIEAVETKKLECGYIFPIDFKDRLDNYKIKRCITCIESPSTILSSLSDEVVFAGLIGEYGKNIAVDFAKENNIVVGDGTNNSEDIARNYERFNTPGKTFSIDYKYIETDGINSDEIKDKTTTYAIHGIESVLILISA
jgi:ABC-2 type transport system permease protein